MNVLKIIVCLLLFGQTGVSQSLIINEFMSSNQSFILDEDGDDSDWIEIFNNTPSSINLSDYYLSDKSNNLALWEFPNITLEAYSFLLIFASGKDRRDTAGELHTNFSIKTSGEVLFLSLDETIIHQTPAVDLSANQSFGLFPDGSTLFTTFISPTPENPNVNTSEEEDQVIFSVEGGIYEQRVQLQFYKLINTNTIYYTLDGTSPTINDIMYTGEVISLTNEMCSNANINQIQMSGDDLHYSPLNGNDIPKGIVIRAASFDFAGNINSEVVTNSYFIKELGINHHLLPIISINAEHADLFDFETGILVPGIYWEEDDPVWTGNYFQRGIDWERKIHVEFYDGHQGNKFKQHCGLRTHGGISRRFPQKGLRLYARSEYGISEFSCPVFIEKETNRFKRFILKPFSSSWSHAGIEDEVCNKMVSGTKAHGIATRPIVLYINGEYWGVYYLQERIDQHFMNLNHGINKDSVDIIENWRGDVRTGENIDFLNLYRFIEDTDLSIEINYDSIKKWIDIDNFIDYQIFEIFIANSDWPGRNMKCWRERKDGAKWQWIFFDGDAALQDYSFNGFEHALNTTGEGWPTNPTATLFLRKLLENKIFYLKFFNRLEGLLNNELSNIATQPYYNDILSLIGEELGNQIYRFSIPKSHDEWSEKVNKVNAFFALRACEIKSQIKEMFNKTIHLPSCNVEGVVISNLSIFPNPNCGNFVFTFSSNYVSPGVIMLTDVLGRSIQQYPITVLKGENLVDFQQLILPEGIVLISVVTEKNISGIKMLFTD